MNLVEAKILHNKITNGVTKPFIILCNNGEQYIVKFQQNPEGKRVLANEFVCARIAELLDLPLANPSLINVSKEFLLIHGNEISEHVGEEVFPGLHFGTQKIKNAFQINTAKIIDTASNKECIPSILLFDQLICNKDRESNGGNLLIDGKEKEIVVIDHTHVFDLGPLWNEYELKRRLGEPFFRIQSNGYVYRKLIPYVDGFSPFHHILGKMKSLNKNIVVDIIESIPEEWDVTKNERIVLSEYIMDRLERIEEALPILKENLPNWKGGI